MYKRYEEYISGNIATIPYGETVIVDEALCGKTWEVVDDEGGEQLFMKDF